MWMRQSWWRWFCLQGNYAPLGPRDCAPVALILLYPVRTSRRANPVNRRLTGDKAHHFWLRWLGRDSWNCALKYRRNVSGVIVRKGSLFRGKPPLRLWINYLAVKTMESQVDPEEKTLSHLWESLGLTHLFSISSAEARRCSLCCGQGNGDGSPRRVLWGNWGIERGTSLSSNSFKNEF